MDYQLNIYTSNESEMKNTKAENNAKGIKVLSENKLSTLYKKAFDGAVKKYNERVTSGRLIDSYYDSILESNIPEVYRLDLIIRYEPLNKNESNTVQKIVTDFKKCLESNKKIVAVSSFLLSYNEFKEFRVFFFPVATGFVTGLSTRNDLIGIVKEIYPEKTNIELNILQAVSLFSEYITKEFEEINNGRLLSQEQLKKIASNKNKVDPKELHSIAINAYKEQFSELQEVELGIKEIEKRIGEEKLRIEHDITWSKEKEKEILAAEQQRLEEEAIEKEKLRKEKEARNAAEAQRREEERLMEEERRVNVSRLAEQAKRNLEMRNQILSEPIIKEEAPQTIDNSIVDSLDDFTQLIEKHLDWQHDFNIGLATKFNNLSTTVLKDARRLCIKNVKFSNINCSLDTKIYGASLTNCSFDNCNLSLSMSVSLLDGCVFGASKFENINFNRCLIKNIKADSSSFKDFSVRNSAFAYAHIVNSNLLKFISSSSNNILKCQIENSSVESSDFKDNTFDTCGFIKTIFKSCDVRGSVFKSCVPMDIQNVDSSFRNAKTI